MMPTLARALRITLSLSVAGLAVACGSAKTPDAVKTELARGPADTVTVVVFSDYECPFCKAAHTELAKALQASPGLKVRFVRHHVPLPSHPHAEMAARAAICVETLGGRTETMDDALFAAGSARLDPGSCEDAAADAGVDRDAFRDCLRAPATDERLRRDLAAYMETSAGGVPLFFVGSARFEGAQDSSTWVDAFARAKASK
jgi:protein-disulfide isomerase